VLYLSSRSTEADYDASVGPRAEAARASGREGGRPGTEHHSAASGGIVLVL